MSYPFDQINLSNNVFIRKFSAELSSEELNWHMDKKDREVTVISGSNWMFQEENKLPLKLSSGDTFVIKKETWHRIIRGDDALSIYIKEL